MSQPKPHLTSLELFRPEKCYIICATHRSGSSLLGDGLDQTGIVGKPEEYFVLHMRRELCAEWGLQNPYDIIAYINRVLEKATTPNQVFGLKIMYQDLMALLDEVREQTNCESLSDWSILTTLFPNLNLVYITRADKLRQAISLTRAQQTDIWGISVDQPNSETPAVTYNFQAIEENLRFLYESEQGWRTWFAQFMLQPLHISYTEISSCFQVTVDKICTYILPRSGGNTPPVKMRLIRQADETTEDWIRQYDKQKRSQQHDSTTPNEQPCPVLRWHDPVKDVTLSEEIQSIPGWLGTAEQELLHWQMRTQYTGVGEVVELGCFLGRSTAAILDGLRHHPLEALQLRRIHVYDSFIWYDGYRDAMGNQRKPALTDQDSFTSVFFHHIAPWQASVRVCQGLIEDATWGGENIEFLFIDIMKSFEAASAVVKTFFPALIPHLSVVIHQDFKHFATPWIHLIMYRLRAYFEPVYSAESSMVYRCIQPLSLETCAVACNYDSFTLAEISAAFDYSMALVENDSDFWKNQIQAARLNAFVQFSLRLDNTIRRSALAVDELKRYATAAFELPTTGLPSEQPNTRYIKEQAYIERIESELRLRHSHEDKMTRLKQTHLKQLEAAHQSFAVHRSDYQWVTRYIPWKILLQALWAKFKTAFRRLQGH